MASGFPPTRELGFGFDAEPGTRPEDAALLKRSLTEMEERRRQQLQQMLFLRSVKQRTHLASPVGLLASPPRLPTPLKSTSSLTTVSSELTPQRRADFGPDMGSDAMRNRLQELERRLLLDDEDDETCASGSALTGAEWRGQAVQQIIFPPPPPPPVLAAAKKLLPSPTNSASSTVSSSASSSPPPPSFTPPPPSSSSSSSRHVLLDAAASIDDGNLEAAEANLAVLKRSANPRGDAEQRLTAIMFATLLARLNPPRTGRSKAIAELCSGEHLAATQMLYDLSPCFKLSLIAANFAILEAVKDQPKIHIVDLDVGQGRQYDALIHALADRHRCRPSSARPPAVKITAVADPTTLLYGNYDASRLSEVGGRIAKLAERAGVGLRFTIVSRRASELDAASLGYEPGEALAVNLAFVVSRVADESVSPANPRDELLRRVRALRPAVVTLVEQEINTNTAAFSGRFAEACGHLGALLESLDATVARESSERERVEAGLARRAVNSVAREGADRVERCEVLGKWRARMGMAGFQPIPVGPQVSEPVKARLASFRSNPGFTIKDEAGGVALGFGWMGRVLTVSSAWR
ncbi:hypothetical protein B296_00044560 [Ensete ventricosum]|uniref:Uncharacterized protein n=1 Tax=Ensete ventricosum TaxID=4639 RepID=A0A426YHQ2_ENSVE|nr:hypothetical protein B296_00044560 [Ensete ventricosum]